MNTTRTSSFLSWNNDAEYRKFVACQLQKRIPKTGIMDENRNLKYLYQHQEKLLSVFLLDFDPVRERLAKLYSGKKHYRSFDPQVIIRSLMLMKTWGETSLTKWANELELHPILAIISGTHPGKTPAVGTYYKFYSRLENGDFEPKSGKCISNSEMRKARTLGCIRPPYTKPEIKPDYEESIPTMQKAVNEAIAGEKERIPDDLEARLNNILMELAVKPSAAKNLISHLDALRVGGDGSTLKSDCNPNGKRLCDCYRLHNLRNCRCDRKYSDPDSAWGWNNRSKSFVYGYRFFQMLDLHPDHNLPIYLNIGPANSYEPKMAIRAIDRMIKMHLKIKESTFDALYDLYAFHRYLRHHKIDCAIPYSKTPAKCVSLGQEGMLFNSDGIPLCPAGKPMLYAGKDEQGRNIFHCPVKRTTHRNGKLIRVVWPDECPRKALCEPDSKMGPLVHVSKDIDYRIHPSIPRNNRRFKQLQNARSTCERSNSMKKHTYKMSQTKIRVMSYAFINLTFISVLEHSRVWAKDMLKKNNFTLANCLSAFS